MSAVLGSSVSTTVPCSADFIGLPLGFQGAGFLTPGGCGTPQISLSDTVQAIIG